MAVFKASGGVDEKTFFQISAARNQAHGQSLQTSMRD
jgi:hypothetical protein